MQRRITFSLWLGPALFAIGLAACASAPPSKPPDSSEAARLSPGASPAARDAAAKCDAKDLAACAELGYMYRRAIGVEKDSDHGVVLYNRACDGGNARGCSYLGAVFLFGANPDDPARGVAILRPACENKDRIGCYNLAWALDHGKGVAKDHAEAAVHYRTSCDLELMDACSNLGFQAEFGRGRAVDLPLALRLYEQACLGGHQPSCAYRAGFIQEGKGGLAKNEAEALAIYQKLCDQEVPEGCAGYGHALLRGRGIKADTARAIAILNKYCEDGSDAACLGMADAYRGGIGLPQDKDKARTLLQQACEGDVPLACEWLKKL